MNPRAVLTMVWLAGLAAAVGVVEAYFLRSTPEGIPWLLPTDRPAAYQTLALLYGAPLSAMLACWFLKPFPPLRHQARLAFAGRLAVVVTVAFQVLTLYLLAQGHWVPDASLPDLLARARSVAGTMAFLVAPVNAAFFGLKPA